MTIKSSLFAKLDEDLRECKTGLTLPEFLRQTILNYVDIQLDKGLVSIESRQYYCDRGRYWVKVFSDCSKTFYVDHQDMFPRYYFDFRNMISELDHWFHARNVNVISIIRRSAI